MRSVATRIIGTESVRNQFSEMAETNELADRKGKDKQWLFTSFASFYRRWIVLEPTIFLFLVAARMVYFTRANLFIDVS